MKKTNILIVDDHPLFTDGLSFLIHTQEQLRVAGIARNGEEALTFLRNKKVCLVLMDLRMPVMDGVHTTRIVKQLYPHLPVVALSANEREDEEVCRMLEAGASLFLHKSATLPELLHVIERALLLVNESISEKKTKTQKSDDLHGFDKLTFREKQIVEFLAGGCTSIQIAQLLNISPLTVKTHRSHIFRKLGVRNVSELVRFTVEKRLKGSGTDLGDGA